jgi:hypothetical protein
MTICMVNVNAGAAGPGDCCQAEAAYIAYVVSCYLCTRARGRDDCVGHTVCDLHAAALMAAALPQRVAGSLTDMVPAVLARLHTLDAESLALAQRTARETGS